MRFQSRLSNELENLRCPKSRRTSASAATSCTIGLRASISPPVNLPLQALSPGFSLSISRLSNGCDSGSSNPLALPKTLHLKTLLEEVHYEATVPSIRDRVVQGALKLILEAIFEADFCPNSYGYRPKRSPHQTLAEVRRSLLRRMSTVIEVDLARYFDTIRHALLLQQIARRVQDPAVLHLVKQILKAGGKIGVPQGGPFSPLAANIYLNEVDWAFDAIRRQTAQGPYEAVNYHRFADDIVVTVSGHDSKRGWAARALQRLQEHLTRLGVEVNREKTKVVDLLRGETFTFLGFEFRRVRKRTGDGHFILLTPRKKARQALKARVRELLQHGGATPLKELIAHLNTVLTGWVQYFRVGNASRAFSEIRDYVEMKIRILLTRRKRRHKRSVGWQRWSNEYLYGVLGLFWDWKLRPLQGAAAYQ